MEHPQVAIFLEDSTEHYYLEYRVRDAGGLGAALRDGLSPLDPPDGAAEPHLVVAFGPDLWRRLHGAREPDFRAFEPIRSPDGYAAPATQHDLLIWIHGQRFDGNLDRALALQEALQRCATLELEERGYRYHDSRDLTGFVDGTANPQGEDARSAAVVAEGPLAGGCFVLTQRWVHALGAFNALPVPEQERVIGRTKPDSVELEGEAMPADSHVSRNDAAGLEVYRRSAPFGGVREHGLYFMAFARDPARFEVLLQRMFGVAGDGLRDRLLEFSSPTTGAYWYAPSARRLEAIASG
jgi:putative iron-dependent peroxidase